MDCIFVAHTCRIDIRPFLSPLTSPTEVPTKVHVPIDSSPRASSLSPLSLQLSSAMPPSLLFSPTPARPRTSSVLALSSPCALSFAVSVRCERARTVCRAKWLRVARCNVSAAQHLRACIVMYAHLRVYKPNPNSTRASQTYLPHLTPRMAPSHTDESRTGTHTRASPHRRLF